MKWQLSTGPEPSAGEPGEGGPDADFWASPVGQAARAKLRGDRFFQIELDDATLTAYAENAAQAGSGRRVRRTCDLLGQIEELGWHLEHVSWWRADRPDPASPEGVGRPQPDVDHVRGVYLFHTVSTPDAEDAALSGATTGAGHAPTHRRDVS